MKPTEKDSRRDSPGLGLVPGWYPVLLKYSHNKIRKMEKKNIEKILVDFATNCTSEDLNGICILSGKIKDKSSMAAVMFGNPVDIILAIIRSMNADHLMKVILEVAFENKDLLKTLSTSEIEKLFRDFQKN